MQLDTEFVPIEAHSSVKTERLEEMRNFGQDYSDELLEINRDIRASEKRFYQKNSDIYAPSIDYDPKAEITKTGFGYKPVFKRLLPILFLSTRTKLNL